MCDLEPAPGPYLLRNFQKNRQKELILKSLRPPSSLIPSDRVMFYALHENVDNNLTHGAMFTKFTYICDWFIAGMLEQCEECLLLVDALAPNIFIICSVIRTQLILDFYEALLETDKV